MVEQILICPKCKNSVGPTDFFCPTCGFKIIGGFSSTSLFKQISIYLLSFLLPPFGLIPAIKYIKQGDDKSKQIGIIAIVLTVISVIISFFILQSFINSYNKALNGPTGDYETLEQLLK